jgi:sirohydrochlorin cobaltochelatase
MDRFEEVEALFMDEAPEVDDVTEFFGSEDVVVVPLFVADGYHTQEDIPEDMGLTEDYRTGWETPAEVDGHRIWYAGAVGTEALTADVLIERAADAGADVGDAVEEVRRKTRTAGTNGDVDADSGADADADADAGAGAEAGD